MPERVAALGEIDIYICEKDKLDPVRMKIVQKKSFATYPLSQAKAELLTAWPKCIRAIDGGNQALALLIKKMNTIVHTFVQHVSTYASVFITQRTYTCTKLMSVYPISLLYVHVVTLYHLPEDYGLVSLAGRLIVRGR